MGSHMSGAWSKGMGLGSKGTPQSPHSGGRGAENVQSCSFAKSCPTPSDPMDCSTPGFLSFTISQSLLKTHVH